MEELHQDQQGLLREEEVGRPARPTPGEAAIQARFRRQSRFAPIGQAGQLRIQRSRVLLVGVGGLGTHLASSLVRAGVGRLWLVDRDIVELDNLQRQVLFDDDDVRHGRPKAVAAASHLRAVGSPTELIPLTEDFSAATFALLDPQPDLILDGTDNFATRYLLNDLAVQHRIPWIYGGALGAEGSAMAILPFTTPCLRCVLPHAPPAGEVGTCETVGVLEPALAAVAAFASAQALKILAGDLDAVARGVLSIDVWRDRWRLVMRGLDRDPGCAACGTRVLPALTNPWLEPVKLCGRDAVQVLPPDGVLVDLAALAGRLRQELATVELQPDLLRFTADGCQFSVFRGGRALLFGTADPSRARLLYDRWIGAC